MKNVTLLDHPILKDKLGQLRNKKITSSEFRALIKEMTRFLIYEATRDLPLISVTVETPLVETNVSAVDSYPVVVSIMRAGNGMLEAANSIMPKCRSGHIGIYRDDISQNTIEYYLKLPSDLDGATALLMEPLIASSDTLVASIGRLKEFGVADIRCLVMLASKEGIEHVMQVHPDVSIYALETEESVDENGYLVPGLGDFGDRFYNTQ